MRSLYALGALITALAVLIVGPNNSRADESKSEPRRVSLVFVNDIHAQLEPHPELFWSGGRDEYVEGVGGLARMATLFNRLRAERADELVFIDGGDTIQGSGPAAWTEGQVVVEPMNALGLDLAIPGNWSVAYGATAWRDRTADFTYPMIAANMRNKGSDELLFKPYLIKKVSGVKVGFLGFTDPEIPTRQPPHLSEGLALDDESILPQYIAELRDEHKVDLLVLVTHIGLPKSIGLADTLEGVDVILSADTHERVYEPIIRGNTWVVEAGSFASFVGVLDIDVDDDKKIADRSWRLIELRPDLFPEDPAMKKVVDAALAPHRDRMNEVIGQTDSWLARYEVLNTTLDRLITDAFHEAAGAEIALSNGYRFSPPTAPGPITVADLWNWLPIPLELQKGEANGAQIRKYWEGEFQNTLADDPQKLHGGWLGRVSGMTVDFKRNAPEGERVTGASVGDKPLKDDQTYTIAAGLRKGAPADALHRVRGGKNIEQLGMSTHDAIEKYLNRHSPVRSDAAPNIRCVDQPGLHMRSQILDKLEGNSR